MILHSVEPLIHLIIRLIIAINRPFKTDFMTYYLLNPIMQTIKQQEQTMTKVLQINSSITGDNSVSRELSKELVVRLAQVSGGIELIERDFSKQPVPHLDGARLGALFTPAENRSAEQSEAVAFADQLID